MIKKRKRNKEVTWADCPISAHQGMPSARPNSYMCERRQPGPAGQLLIARARPTDIVGPLLGLTALTALAVCHRDVGPARQPEDPLASVLCLLHTTRLAKSSAACAVKPGVRCARPGRGCRIRRSTNSTTVPCRPLSPTSTAHAAPELLAVSRRSRLPSTTPAVARGALLGDPAGV